jgi:hypothetical protein
MIDKHLIRPERVRQIPSGFSWVDHRLIRERRMEGCAPGAWALYLFLVTVADAQGLSYYSEAALSRHLHLEPLALGQMRHQLVQADLIAYQKPLYQVLSLPEAGSASAGSAPPRRGQMQSVGEILRHALGGGAV